MPRAGTRSIHPESVVIENDRRHGHQTQQVEPWHPRLIRTVVWLRHVSPPEKDHASSAPPLKMLLMAVAEFAGFSVSGAGLPATGCRTSHTRPESVPAVASSATTIQGGSFQTVSSKKPPSASAKSRCVRTALVQTGL
jgi:hypothetical protein